MSKIINNRKIISSVVCNQFYDGKRNKSKHGVSRHSSSGVGPPACMTFLMRITISIWNFFHLIIPLKKLFLRKGNRMNIEIRRLIERHYSCYSRIPIIRVPR